MGLFDQLVRLGLPLLPRFAVGWMARKYVAGETLEQAVEVVRQLNDQGAMATLDLLGEQVTDARRAEDAVQQYHRMLDTIASASLQCNVSVKPSQVGLQLDPELCQRSLISIVEHAARRDNFVRLDMEDHSTTDATLRIYRHLRHKLALDNVGVVLQSMLRRTLEDAGALSSLGSNVRVVKGIYREPRAVAWQARQIVQQSFARTTEKLLAAGCYVGIATHDEQLVWAALEQVDRLGIGPADYEFQMLLGVDQQLRQIILDQGHRLRVYVPFGRDWYPYTIRRLRENPTVAWHALQALLRRG